MFNCVIARNEAICGLYLQLVSIERTQIASSFLLAKTDCIIPNPIFDIT